MTKPIFIVKLPRYTSQAEIHKYIDTLSRMIELHRDYHVLPIMATETNHVEFEVLNAVHAKDEDIEKIKQEVYKSLKQTKDERTTTI